MGSRIILFPTERSLGELTLQERGNNYSWIKLGEAKGQIVAPLDKELTLTIDHSVTDFNALSKLAVDAVDILDFNNTKVTDSDLRACFKSFALSLRSRRRHKAWGVSPRAR